jgi:hypothetical protein
MKPITGQERRIDFLRCPPTIRVGLPVICAKIAVVPLREKGATVDLGSTGMGNGMDRLPKSGT